MENLRISSSLGTSRTQNKWEPPPEHCCDPAATSRKVLQVKSQENRMSVIG